MDEVHRLLYEESGLGPTALFNRLVQRGFLVKSVSNVKFWVGQLRRERRIDAKNRALMPPLYPAYLLLDVADAERRRVRSEVATTHPDYRMDTVTGLVNTLIRVACRPGEEEALRERCVQAGAREARALLVTRSDAAG